MKYAISHKDSPKEYKRRQSIERRKRDPVGYLLTQAKYRAKKRGILFTVTRNDIEVPTHCPALGIKLEHSEGRRTHASFSLDRKDNTQGYVPGNVRVISWKANQYKGDLTIEEVRGLLRYMEGI